MKFKDIKILSKNTLIYGIGNGLTQLVNVLLAPLYATYLSADRFGVRALTVAIDSIIRLISVLALDQALIADYHKVKSQEERRRVVSTAFTLSAVISLIIGLLFFSLSMLLPQVCRLFNISISSGILGLKMGEAKYILRIFSIYLGLTPPTLVFFAYLRSIERPTFFSVFVVSKSLVKVTLLVLSLVVLGRGLRGLYEADMLLAVISFPVLLFSIYKFTRGVKISFTHLKSMFSYALPLIPSLVFVWIRNLGDRFLIQSFLTEAQVGIFAYAKYFPNIITFLIITPLTLSWTPYAFSIKDKPTLPGYISRILTYFFLVSGWVLILLGGSSYEILRIVSSRPDYWLGAPFVPLLVLGICLYGVHYIIGTPCQVKRKTIYFSITTFISASVTIAINLWLLPRIGLWASAIGFLLSYLAMLIAMIFFSRKLMKIPFEKRRIILISIISILITFIFYVFSENSPFALSAGKFGEMQVFIYWYSLSPLIRFIIKAISGSVLYFALLAITNFVLPREKDFIKKLFSQKAKIDHT